MINGFKNNIKDEKLDIGYHIYDFRIDSLFLNS